MVFEQFLESKAVKRHPLFSIFLGIFYVTFSYIIAGFFFTDNVSIAVVFISTLFIVPSFNSLVIFEEKIDSKEGIKHFFHNHKMLLKILFFLSVGIFIAYLILALVAPNAFDYQFNVLEGRGDLLADTGAIEGYEANFENVLGIFSKNVAVILIAFGLSVFYGAGALFLIILNASVFSYYIYQLAMLLKENVFFVGLYFVHILPEVVGFFIAAIAGALFSRAIIRERLGSDEFRNVTRDVLVLLLIALLLIAIGAILEVYASTFFIKTLV